MLSVNLDTICLTGHQFSCWSLFSSPHRDFDHIVYKTNHSLCLLLLYQSDQPQLISILLYILTNSMI